MRDAYLDLSELGGLSALGGIRNWGGFALFGNILEDSAHRPDNPVDSRLFWRILEGVADRHGYTEITYLPIDFRRPGKVYRVVGGLFVSRWYGANRPAYWVLRGVGGCRGFYTLSVDSAYLAENSALRNRINHLLPNFRIRPPVPRRGVGRNHLLYSAYIPMAFSLDFSILDN